jgi:hypothetical protein
MCISSSWFESLQIHSALPDVCFDLLAAQVYSCILEPEDVCYNTAHRSSGKEVKYTSALGTEPFIHKLGDYRIKDGHGRHVTARFTACIFTLAEVVSDQDNVLPAFLGLYTEIQPLPSPFAPITAAHIQDGKGRLYKFVAQDFVCAFNGLAEKV